MSIFVGSSFDAFPIVPFLTSPWKANANYCVPLRGPASETSIITHSSSWLCDIDDSCFSTQSQWQDRNILRSWIALIFARHSMPDSIGGFHNFRVRRDIAAMLDSNVSRGVSRRLFCPLNHFASTATYCLVKNQKTTPPEPVPTIATRGKRLSPCAPSSNDTEAGQWI